MHQKNNQCNHNTYNNARKINIEKSHNISQTNPKAMFLNGRAGPARQSEMWMLCSESPWTHLGRHCTKAEKFHWIGLRENLQETKVFTIKYRAFL